MKTNCPDQQSIPPFYFSSLKLTGSPVKPKEDSCSCELAGQDPQCMNFVRTQISKIILNRQNIFHVPRISFRSLWNKRSSAVEMSR